MQGRYLRAFSGLMSYTASVLSRRPIMMGMPFAVSVELTNCCNLKCPECPSGSGQMRREKGFMDLALFRKIMDEKGAGFLQAGLYFQGEPMMHPEFFEFLKAAAGVYSTVSTNGHFLSRENAERLSLSPLGKLIISLDGATPETYGVYRRNGDMDGVISGIGRIGEARRRNRSALKVEVQFLVNRFNEAEAWAVKRIALNAGASFRMKSMQVINPGDAGYWMPENDKFCRYVKTGSGYAIKSSMPDRCARLWFNPVITWDGKVVPCCFDKDAEFVMGDVGKSTFREIWYGKEYAVFRERLLKNRSQTEMCRNCTSGLKNSYL